MLKEKICVNELTENNLPSIIPMDVRTVYVKTVEKLLSQLNIVDGAKYKKYEWRVQHMIRAAYIVSDVASDSSTAYTELVCGTIAALFHDIFKLTRTGNTFWKLDADAETEYTDAEYNLYDLHSSMGAVMTVELLKMHSVDLDEAHLKLIHDIILNHSNKDYKAVSENDIYKIVIEADIIEKIGPSTLSKKYGDSISKIPSEDVLEFLEDHKKSYTSKLSIIETPYSSIMYNERILSLYVMIESIEKFYKYTSI